MQIPFMVCGGLKAGKEQSLDFGPKKEGIKLFLPKVTPEDIKEIRESRTDALHDLSIDEVIDFYSRVGKLWGSMKYDRREELVDLTCRVTGYSREMIELGMQQICSRPIWVTRGSLTNGSPGESPRSTASQGGRFSTSLQETYPQCP